MNHWQLLYYYKLVQSFHCMKNERDSVKIERFYAKSKAEFKRNKIVT